MATVAELITLLLALLGIFSKTVRESADGTPARSRYGLPSLTLTGGVVVLLLLCASAVKVRMVQTSENDRRQDQVTAKQQIKNLTEKLRDAQSKLDEARLEIHQGREENTRDFKSVLEEQQRGLRETVRKLSDTSVLLRRGVKQNKTLASGFFITLFFEPVPEDLEDSFYNGSQPGQVHQSVVNGIFCRSPLQLQDLFIWVPLTSTPPLNLRVGFRNVLNGQCEFYAHLNTVDSNNHDLEKNVDLGGVAVFKNGRRAAFRIGVDGKDLKALGISEGIPMIEFQASKQAMIKAVVENFPQKGSHGSLAYLARTLPTMVGVNVNASNNLYEPDLDLQATWVFKRHNYGLEEPRNLSQWGLYEFLFEFEH